MFVLPPPPRYPSQVAYAVAAANGMPIPTIETNNILTHPEGPEYQWQVGEGTYVLRDQLHLATPPPHPSEAPVTSANPLATGPVPPTSGVKLSLTIIKPRKSVPQLYKVNTKGSAPPSDLRNLSIRESERESRPSAESGSEAGAGMPTESNDSGSAPAFGGDNLLLASTSREGLKRRKPKNNMVKSNSSFVSRVIPHDGLPKRLQDRSQDGLFVFANINRAYQWLDFSSATKTEPMTKILFTKAHMICHDINPLTKTSSHLDIVMGSSAADIIWYEPMTQKYARINKNGIINPSPVSQIRWIPGSESLFLASHMDGSLVVYDKEKEDAPFVAEEAASSEDPATLHVMKSVNSKNQKTNPIAFWKLSNQRINNFAFSPDSRHLAVVSEDGSLRIIDYLKEKLTDLYTSYYGGFTCVCWSPDGKYVLTGGQDDLVSIWSLGERQIVARCAGHHSWVTAVAFDPWRCDEKNYRFGSVGEDCRLLLWDFSVGMLHRPKAVSSRRHRTESQSTNRLRSDSNPISVADKDGVVNHAVEPRARTAQLPPVMSKVIDADPLCFLGFEEDFIITSCQEGHIRTWDRPKEGVTGSQVTLPGVQQKVEG